MVILKIISILIFVYCYQEGGQGKKYLRHWVGPLVFAGLGILSMLGNFSWLNAVGYLLFLVAANGFSYGEKFTHNKEGLKILFRGLCGISYGFCMGLVAVGQGHVILGLLHLVVATSCSIYFGVYSPIPEWLGDWKTRIEDILISTSYVI